MATAKPKTPARPSSVRVGWHDWSLSFLSAEEWHGRQDLSVNNAGETHPATQAIYIVTEHPSGTMTEMRLREVVVHELMHCAFDVTGMTHTHARLRRNDVEEALCGALSGPLLAVLRDNPVLTAWLLAP